MYISINIYNIIKSAYTDKTSNYIIIDYIYLIFYLVKDNPCIYNVLLCKRIILQLQKLRIKNRKMHN